MLFVCHPKILHKQCFQFLLGVKMAPREAENNVMQNVGGDKQRALWYVMVFSGVVNVKTTDVRIFPRKKPTKFGAFGQIFQRCQQKMNPSDFNFQRAPTKI